jgi:hypothetical protein
VGSGRRNRRGRIAISICSPRATPSSVRRSTSCSHRRRRKGAR